ncbi:NO-binding membrane sensor protein with MHYT domain [Murinocardiopsis flavida]|uniref:NO-binding membrane sensor protein with MHYT domain n=1 Tax=Murinocardiopsis flavida TaxID=645275 RepID=A0A2P8DLT4_9ACTN|nr:MHYT domain-containing protein [Murinocardiopsis flavida]PSK98179.1 NO-binding membrane sensor protein with MHYT domain [Murinocardiopsis flavida]
MTEIDHFTYGLWTPGLAYAVSFIGSLLGLGGAAQALTSHGPNRVGWLAMGAVSLGGTGIWAMHFIAMLGFSVRGAPLRYDVLLTVASAVLAIAVVAVGLTLVTRAPRSVLALVSGGAVTGAGVAAMHYTGMASMRVAVPLHHDPRYAAAAIAIAVVASTAALWAATRVSGGLATTGASLVMAAAVCAMHYTGMAGMSVGGGDHGMAHGTPETPSGASIMDFFLPLYAVVGLVTLVFAVILVSVRADRADRDDSRPAAAPRADAAPAGGAASVFTPPPKRGGADPGTHPRTGQRRPGGPA